MEDGSIASEEVCSAYVKKWVVAVKYRYQRHGGQVNNGVSYSD